MVWPFQKKQTTAQSEMRPRTAGYAMIADKLEEVLSGLGGSSDRVSKVKFKKPETVGNLEIEDAVEYDGILERFICKPVEDALCEGIDFEKLSEEEESAVEDYLEKIDFWARIEEALVTRRMNRGSAIWIDTGSIDNSKPFAPNEIYRLKRLVVLDSDALSAENYKVHDDPSMWYVGNADLGGVRRIHPSRLLLFPGRFISRWHRSRNRGWGAREIDKVWEAWISFRITFLMPPNIAMTYEEGIFGLEGLNQKMTSDAGRELIRKKVFDLEAVRSFLRMRVKDVNDTFERSGAPIAGLDAVMDRAEAFFVAQTGLPRSILFGWSRGSNLNSDGKGEEQNKLYQGVLRGIQKSTTPQIKYFLSLIQPMLQSRTGLPLKDLEFCWEKADHETPLEKADRELKEAQRDKIYVGELMVVDAGELRADIAKRSMYPLDPATVPQIDPSVMEDE
jgi:hypothetical protein